MKRYKVERSDDGDSLGDGRDHTWDVIDRATSRSVRNTDTRAAARAAAAELEREASEPVALCDKCEGPNDRANESNYCSPCGAAYQARVRLDPETQPVGTG